MAKKKATKRKIKKKTGFEKKPDSVLQKEDIILNTEAPPLDLDVNALETIEAQLNRKREEGTNPALTFRVPQGVIDKLKIIARNKAIEEDKDVHYVDIIKEGMIAMEKKYKKYLK